MVLLVDQPLKAKGVKNNAELAEQKLHNLAMKGKAEEGDVSKIIADLQDEVTSEVAAETAPLTNYDMKRLINKLSIKHVRGISTSDNFSLQTFVSVL